jgi:hypothetical protein
MQLSALLRRLLSQFYKPTMKDIVSKPVEIDEVRFENIVVETTILLAKEPS